MARPKKEINEESFEKLCALQCTKREVCFFFDVTEKTLMRWCRETYGESFSRIFQKKRVAGLISLRRAQFVLAMKSPAMAIFLGKNYLGQTGGDYLKNEYNTKMLGLKEREVNLKEEGF